MVNVKIWLSYRNFKYIAPFTVLLKKYGPILRFPTFLLERLHFVDTLYNSPKFNGFSPVLSNENFGKTPSADLYHGLLVSERVLLLVEAIFPSLAAIEQTI